MQKFLLRISLILTILFSVFIPEAKSHGMLAPIQEHKKDSSIEVKGTAKELFKSDVAYIQFSITSLADSAESANKINTEESKEIFKKLKNHGITEKELELINFRIYEKKEYNHKEKKSEILGYEATKFIKAKVTKMNEIADIIDILSSSSYTELSSINYDLEDQETAKLSVYKKATRNAIRKAEAIVSEIDSLKLGEIIKIRDSDINYISPQRNLMRASPKVYAMASESSADNDSIPQNEIEISTEIYIDFELIN